MGPGAVDRDDAARDPGPRRGAWLLPISPGDDAGSRGDDPGDAAWAGRVAPPGEDRNCGAASTGLHHDAGEYRPAGASPRHHRAGTVAGPARAALRLTRAAGR